MMMQNKVVCLSPRLILCLDGPFTWTLYHSIPLLLDQTSDLSLSRIIHTLVSIQHASSWLRRDF